MSRKVLITAGLGLAVLLVLVFAIGQKSTREEREEKDITETEVDSLYNAAISSQSKGEFDKAVKLYQELIKKFPRDEKAMDSWYKLGKIYESEDLWEKAKDAYSEIIANFPNFGQISDVEKRRWDLSIKILFSPIVTDKDIIYEVKPGETLSKIAANFNTTADLIMRSNNLESDLIRPGKRLKISTAKYSAIVDKSQNSLTLKRDEEIFKVYPVATGAYNCTPTGSFKIVEKLKNPDWYKKGEGPIPADSPENILGTRWLGLSEPEYGIHGGASREDLGKQVTNGCVRMTDSDVEELFTILPRGIEVIIVD